MKAFFAFLLLFVSFCAAASNFYPTTITVTSGSKSSQPLSALATNDQSGSADDWNKYIEFYGSSSVFQGTFRFDVSSISASSVTSFSLAFNYKGPQKADQTWRWEWFNPTTNSYVVAGDNTGAADWSWTLLTLAGTGTFSNYVSSAGILVLRYSSLTASDDCDLDFVQLSVVTSTTTPPTPPPTPSPTPSTTPAPPGAKLCPGLKVWAPTPLTTFHIQYTGTIDYTRNVQAYNIDMFDSVTPTISANLHSRNISVVCYFSSQYENWRPDASSFTEDILGNNLDDWEGERWVDIRSTTLRTIMTNRMDIAVSKGCDAIDVDNVDEYTYTNNGFGITAAQQINFNTFLATEAHARGLSISLKNDLDQISTLVSLFDFAVNEQCNQYNECNYLDPFVAAGKAVFGIEYSGSASAKCPGMITKQFTFTYKALSLNAAANDCCNYDTVHGCTNFAQYLCKTY